MIWIQHNNACGSQESQVLGSLRTSGEFSLGKKKKKKTGKGREDRALWKQLPGTGYPKTLYGLTQVFSLPSSLVSGMEPMRLAMLEIQRRKMALGTIGKHMEVYAWTTRGTHVSRSSRLRCE